MAQANFGELDFWREGLDRSFTANVYKRSAQIGLLAALIFMAFDQRQIALGLLSGLGMGLFSTWTVEVTVRLLFRGGGFAAVKLAIAAFVKMPMMLAALLGIAWASYNHFMNAFAVVGGVLLVHATMLVMVIGTALAAQDSNRERYR